MTNLIVQSSLFGDVAEPMAASDDARVGSDYYPTPEAITLALLKIMAEVDGWASGTKFEPCCGLGAISAVLKEQCPDACVTATDILMPPHPRFEAIQTRDATLRQFWEQWHRYCGGFDWVVSNPPFNKASEIVPYAFEFCDRGIAFILRLSYIEPCQDRYNWLSQYVDNLRYFAPINPRPRFRKDKKGSDNATVCWLVFDKQWSWKEKQIDCPFKFITQWKTA